jgi:hypothetical protein
MKGAARVYTENMLRGFLLSLVLVAAAHAQSAGGISWTAPPAWKAQPDRPMRAATYVVPAAPGGQEDGECAVFYFGAGQGGGVDANIERWIKQFEDGPPTPAKPRPLTVAGLKVTTIEHSGTYLAGGPMMKGAAKKPGYQLVGAIVEAPEGNVFFKLTGPAKTVQAARGAFDKMIHSVRKSR